MRAVCAYHRREDGRTGGRSPSGFVVETPLWLARLILSAWHRRIGARRGVPVLRLSRVSGPSHDRRTVYSRKGEHAEYHRFLCGVTRFKVSPIDDMPSSVSHSHLIARTTSGNSRSIVFALVRSDVESNRITLSAGTDVLVHRAEVDFLKEKPQ